MTESTRSVEVSRRIEASPERIFDVLARPQRHADFDGSRMVTGAVEAHRISGVGERFTTTMHRLGRDYEMINHVVEFEKNRAVAWEPSPGDLDTAGDDPAKIGVPAGYRWGFRLVPESETLTLVTEFFDCGTEGNQWILEQEGGSWINGHNPVIGSMERTLELLESISTT